AAGFFLQAGDGIRDRNVTGVQTCALPIFHRPTAEGLSTLQRELSARREDLEKIYADWDEEDIESFARLLRKHNASLEAYLEMPRSEERRVGKECRARWSQYPYRQRADTVG